MNHAAGPVGNRLAIVYPREPMPGVLGVAVPEDRLDEMRAFEQERTRRHQI